MDPFELDRMIAPAGAFTLLSSGHFAGEQLERLEQVCFDYWVSWKGGMKWERAIPGYDPHWLDGLPDRWAAVREDYLDTWMRLRCN